MYLVEAQGLSAERLFELGSITNHIHYLLQRYSTLLVATFIHSFHDRGLHGVEDLTESAQLILVAQLESLLAHLFLVPRLALERLLRPRQHLESTRQQSLSFIPTTHSPHPTHSNSPTSARGLGLGREGTCSIWQRGQRKRPTLPGIVMRKSHVMLPHRTAIGLDLSEA